MSESRSIDPAKTHRAGGNLRVVGRALLYGLRRRCPRCGEQTMFRTWFAIHPNCAACDLRFEESPGDIWGFWLIGDRVFLALLILALFVIFQPDDWITGGILLVVTLVPLLWTMPHRLGFCLALDYLSRVYLHTSDLPPPTAGTSDAPPNSPDQS